MLSTAQRDGGSSYIRTTLFELAGDHGHVGADDRTQLRDADRRGKMPRSQHALTRTRRMRNPTCMLRPSGSWSGARPATAGSYCSVLRCGGVWG